MLTLRALHLVRLATLSTMMLASSTSSFSQAWPAQVLARSSASEVLTVVSKLVASMGWLLSAPHMLAVRGEAERIVSNLMAHLARAGSHWDLARFLAGHFQRTRSAVWSHRNAADDLTAT